MTDLQLETPLLLSALGKRLDLTYMTMRNYALFGYRVRDAKGKVVKVVKMSSIMTPEGRKASVEDYHRFIGAINS